MFKKKSNNPLVQTDEEDEIKKPRKRTKTKSVKVNNNKRLTGKQKLGIVLILFTVVTMFVIEPLYSDFKLKDEVVIAVLNNDIAQGNIITSDDVTTENIPKSLEISSLFLTKDEVIGKYAATDLTANEPIMRTQVSDKLNFKNDYLYTLENGKQAISITIPSLASGVSSKVQADDIVSIYSYKESNDVLGAASAAYLPTELTYVKVLDVSTSEALSVDDSNTILSTVTLEVDKTQAEVIVNLENSSKIHLSIISRGNTEYANELLNAQQNLIAQIDTFKAKEDLTVEN